MNIKLEVDTAVGVALIIIALAAGVTLLKVSDGLSKFLANSSIKYEASK